MPYKIIKTTPANTSGYSLGVTYQSFRQAKDALNTIKLNYDLDRDETQAYFHNRKRNFVAYHGGDRLEFYITKSAPTP